MGDDGNSGALAEMAAPIPEEQSTWAEGFLFTRTGGDGIAWAEGLLFTRTGGDGLTWAEGLLFRRTGGDGLEVKDCSPTLATTRRYMKEKTAPRRRVEKPDFGD